MMVGTTLPCGGSRLYLSKMLQEIMGDGRDALAAAKTEQRKCDEHEDGR
jgi:hypothetical protein